MGLQIRNVDLVKPFPKIHGISIKLTINQNVKPVQQPLRRIPIALEETVSQKLDEALQSGITEAVCGPSQWISPIVIAFKGNGDVRICIDMRRANLAILRENYPLPTFDLFMTKLKSAKIFTRLDSKNTYNQLELHESAFPACYRKNAILM